MSEATARNIKEDSYLRSVRLEVIIVFWKRLVMKKSHKNIQYRTIENYQPKV
jgi:hypothetical protein